MTVPSPRPRRVKRPTWLDPRLLVGILLVLASVLIGARVVSSASRDYRILAVSRDLASGTVLGAADVRAVSVRLPDHGRGVYLDAGTAVTGRQLNRPFARGELLAASALGAPAAATTLTVPLDDGDAPVLHAGQRIEVWISTKLCPSLVLLGDVTVQGVSAAGGGAFSSGSGQTVVLSVEPQLAERVVSALALDGVVIRAGVLSGTPVPGANTALPDVSSCAPQSGSS